MCFRRIEKGKSKVLSGGFCLQDSEAEQRVLQLLHIHCSNVGNYSSAPEPNKHDPPDRTLGIPFFFRYKHITFLKNSFRLHQTRVYRTGFRATLRLCLL